MTFPKLYKRQLNTAWIVILFRPHQLALSLCSYRPRQLILPAPGLQLRICAPAHGDWRYHHLGVITK